MKETDNYFSDLKTGSLFIYSMLKNKTIKKLQYFFQTLSTR